jgi:hypothetical protein
LQYAEVLDRIRGPEMVSAMTYSPNMKYLYLACTVGWLIGLATLRGRARVLVAAASAAFIFWSVYSIVYLLLLNTTWVPPIPLYLEQGLLPLYLAGAVAGYWGVLRATARLFARIAAPLALRVGAAVRRPAPASLSAHTSNAQQMRRAAGLQRVGILLAILCVVVLPGKVIHYALTDAQPKANIFYEAWANEPELIQFLSENIGLATDQPFRGAINLLSPIGFTMATLWARGVPTINEYSQLITPDAFYFVHALLKRDVRGHLNLFHVFWSNGTYSPAYWKTLEMFGTRYSATVWPLPAPFNPGFPLTTKPYRPREPDQKPGTWYIYELPHPNVGNYSPTEVVTAGPGAEIMAALSKPDFDFARQVVLSAPLDEPLVPARDMRLSTIRGGYHLSGRSDGTSLIVLPLQFTHCLRARDNKVRFVRANLMMAGVIFFGNIDTDILFDYGIVSPGCRRADLAEMKRLDLKIDLRQPHLSGDRLFPDWDSVMSRLGEAATKIR